MISSHRCSVGVFVRLVVAIFAISALGSCEDDSVPILAPSYIDVTPKSLEFGRSPIGSSIRKELVVRNTGKKSLNVTGIKFLGDTSAFSLRQVPGSVDAQDKKSAIIEFRPHVAGEFTALLLIESDADNNRAFRVTVTGQGVDDIFCGDCDSPPENSCLTAFDLEVYDLLGACNGGECEYQQRVVACSGRCENDKCVDNDIPVATISLLPNPAFTTDDLVVSASVADGNGDSTTLKYEWFQNQTLMPDEVFSTISATKTSKGDEWLVRVTPNDGQLSGSKVSKWLTVANSPPLISTATVSPAHGTEQTSFNCAASGARDYDQDILSFTYQWTVSGQVSLAEPLIDGASFNKGDTIVCTITPNDGEEDGQAVSSAPILIQNSTPSVSLVYIGPPAPNELTTVTATISGWDDPDGDIAQYRYSWSVNSATVSTSKQIDGSLFQRGDTVELIVTPFDGVVTGSPVRSNQLVVGNASPNISSVSLDPLPAFTNDTLTAFPWGWYDADFDTESYTYEWFVNSVSIVAGPSLGSNRFVRDDQVRVQVTPFDGIDRGLIVSSASITISNSAPSIGVASISPGSGNETTVFTCLAMGWQDLDGDQPSYQYQWYINNNLAVTSTSIDGTHIDRGDRIRCVITPNDGRDLGPSQSSGTLLVENTAPSINLVTISPNTGDESTMFRCVPSGWFDADGDSPHYVYQWFVNEVPVVSSSTITGSSFSRNDQLRCEVTPNDVIDLGVAISSSTVTIVNIPPSLASAYLTPDPAFTDSDIIVVPLGWNDLDGDPESYLYEWFVNGLQQFTFTDTLDHSRILRGDHIYAQITPSDGSLGAPVVTATLTVSNSLPSITSATVTPTLGNETTNFSCVAGGWSDQDNDVPGYSFVWFVNSSSVSSAPNLDGSSFVRGDNISCVATPTDGIDAGPAVSSQTVQIGNAAPSILSVSITPPFGGEETVFGCTPQGWYDPDGDTPIYDYQWYVNGNASVTTPSIDGLSFDRDHRIRCEVRPNDGQGAFGLWVASSTVTVENTPPLAATATITPASPTDADELLCSVLQGSFDADGDSVTYGYEWTNGSTISFGSTITSTQTTAGEIWTCTVTPNDGTAAGQATSVSTGVLGVSCSIPDGSRSECFAIDCSRILSDGYSTGDGLYWINPTGIGTPYQVHCLMDVGYDGGGWTLIAVSSDDSQDTWTWNNRNYWDSDQQLTGSINALNRDFKSAALHQVAASDMMFLHAPSGKWASYNEVSIAGFTFAESIASISGPICYGTTAGYPMAAGTITPGGDLCSTELFLNPQDQEGGTDCNCPTCSDHTYGPAWSTGANVSCPHDEPGSYGGLGPQAQYPSSEGNASTVGNPLGFGRTLGLNTGITGAAENYIQAYVRTIDSDGDGYSRYEDCNDGNVNVYPRAGDGYGDGIDSDCDGLDCEASSDGSTYFLACPDNSFDKNAYEFRCQDANYDGLASIRTVGEQVFVDQLIDQTGSNPTTQREAFYIGYDTATGTSSDGSSTGYTNWATGEPSGDGTCTVMNWLLPGLWNDISCSWNAGGGICQGRSPAPLGFSRIYEAESALSHRVGRIEGNAWSANTLDDQPEHMAYGPYARDWPEGILTVTFRLMIDVVNNSPEQVASIDVFDATAGQVLAGRGINRNEFRQGYEYQDFYLTVDITGRRGNALETRVYWNDTSYVKLDYTFVSD